MIKILKYLYFFLTQHVLTVFEAVSPFYSYRIVTEVRSMLTYTKLSQSEHLINT